VKNVNCKSEAHRRTPLSLFTFHFSLFTFHFLILQSQGAFADESIAATVNGEPITVAEVERAARQAARNRKIAEDAKPLLLSATLSRLVDQRLVHAYLIEKKHGAKPAEIDLAMKRAEDALAQQKIGLDDHLKTLGITREQFRTETAWRIAWRRYLEAHATDENLARYFEKHRPHFDGGKRRVAHILFKVEPAGDEAARVDAMARAEAVRAEIEAKSISFADAARKHSAAPTADKGGDIGWISRGEPMPETFSKAAFNLQPGEISQPIVSPFGVHLIECLEIKPGGRTWKDAKTELRHAVNQYLFDWIAKKQRAQAQIEFTGAIPPP
jgi:parvulin-like peptidyl-prolyl isomerase